MYTEYKGLGLLALAIVDLTSKAAFPKVYSNTRPHMI